MAADGVKFPSARQGVWMRDQSGVPVFTRPWFLFFQAVWARQGGSSAPDVGEIMDDFAQGPSGADAQVLALSQQQLIEQLSGEVSQLSADLAELAKAIQDLRQGVLI